MGLVVKQGQCAFFIIDDREGSISAARKNQACAWFFRAFSVVDRAILFELPSYRCCTPCKKSFLPALARKYIFKILI